MSQPKTNAVKRRKKRRNRGKIALAIFLMLAIVTLVILSFTVFFNISKIDVKGDTRYTAKEIIKESEIKIGDNMFALSDKKLNILLTYELPYLESVEVKRSLPDKITLTVKEITPEYAFKVNGQYLLVGKSKSLEMVDKLPKGVTLIESKVKEYEIGKAFSTGENNELFQKISDALEKNKLGKITKMDFSDSSKIILIYDGRITLELGSVENIDKKIKKAIKIIDAVDSDYNGKAEGTVKLQYDDGYFDKATSSQEATSSSASSSVSSSSTSSTSSKQN